MKEDSVYPLPTNSLPAPYLLLTRSLLAPYLLPVSYDQSRAYPRAIYWQVLPYPRITLESP